MTNFLERFKGKTSLMGKEGLPGLVSENDRPIVKPTFISIINEKESPQNQKSLSLKSLKLETNLTRSNQRNFHSISSQSTKPSHLIQAAKNSIGMATYDFSPERNNYSYINGTSGKEPKIPLSASPFVSKNYMNHKQRITPFSASLDVKKESYKGGGASRQNRYNGEKEGNNVKGKKGIQVIKEQIEEPEEDFEELEKKHLEFLSAIERMQFK